MQESEQKFLAALKDILEGDKSVYPAIELEKLNLGVGLIERIEMLQIGSNSQSQINAPYISKLMKYIPLIEEKLIQPALGVPTENK